MVIEYILLSHLHCTWIQYNKLALSTKYIKQETSLIFDIFIIN